MTLFSRRSLFVSALLVGTLPTATLLAADQPTEIRVDWATYNPVSILLKERGWLEKEFAKDGISIRWVQSAGSNKALEFLNAGSIDFGSTAGSAALLAKINGNPIKSIYVYSKPEWTALVTRKDFGHQDSRGSEGQACRCHARYRPAYLPGPGVAGRQSWRKGHSARAAPTR